LNREAPPSPIFLPPVFLYPGIPPDDLRRKKLSAPKKSNSGRAGIISHILFFSSTVFVIHLEFFPSMCSLPQAGVENPNTPPTPPKTPPQPTSIVGFIFLYPLEDLVLLIRGISSRNSPLLAVMLLITGRLLGSFFPQTPLLGSASVPTQLPVREARRITPVNCLLHYEGAFFPSVRPFPSMTSGVLSSPDDQG